MRVVIADDQPDVVVHLKEIIEELGHDAVGFTDGEAFSDSISQKYLILLFWIGILRAKMAHPFSIGCARRYRNDLLSLS